MHLRRNPRARHASMYTQRASALGKRNPLKFIGLIPAAGYATRLGTWVTGSKELVPIPTPTSPARPVCEYLLQQMRQAGIERAIMVIRDDKRDIPAHCKDGGGMGLMLSYIMTSATAGVPHTLDRAYGQIRDAVVVLGFPDILVHEQDCLARLIQDFRARPVDILLGLFPLGDAHTMDAVDVVERRVRRVVPKPGPTTLSRTWAYAVWGNRFTEFLHSALASHPATSAREVYMGDVIQDAITGGLTVEGIAVSARPFLDIGTPEGLRAAQQRSVAPL